MSRGLGDRKHTLCRAAYSADLAFASLEAGSNGETKSSSLEKPLVARASCLPGGHSFQDVNTGTAWMSLIRSDLEPPGPRNTIQKGRSPSVPHAVLAGYDHAAILRDGIDVVVQAEGRPLPEPAVHVLCGRSHTGGKIYFKGPGNSAISSSFHGWPIRGWKPLDAHTVGIVVAPPPNHHQGAAPAAPPPSGNTVRRNKKDKLAGLGGSGGGGTQSALATAGGGSGGGGNSVAQGVKRTARDQEAAAVLLDVEEERRTKALRPSRAVPAPVRYRNSTSSMLMDGGSGEEAGPKCSPHVQDLVSGRVVVTTGETASTGSDESGTWGAVGGDGGTLQRDGGTDSGAVSAYLRGQGHLSSYCSSAHTLLPTSAMMPSIAAASLAPSRHPKLNSHASVARPPMSRIAVKTRVPPRPVITSSQGLNTQREASTSGGAAAAAAAALHPSASLHRAQASAWTSDCAGTAAAAPHLTYSQHSGQTMQSYGAASAGFAAAAAMSAPLATYAHVPAWLANRPPAVARIQPSASSAFVRVAPAPKQPTPCHPSAADRAGAPALAAVTSDATLAAGRVALARGLAPPVSLVLPAGHGVPAGHVVPSPCTTDVSSEMEFPLSAVCSSEPERQRYGQPSWRSPTSPVSLAAIGRTASTSHFEGYATAQSPAKRSAQLAQAGRDGGGYVMTYCAPPPVVGDIGAVYDRLVEAVLASVAQLQ